MSFGSNGVNTFQRSETIVAIQICEKWAFFTLEVNCYGYKIKLWVETLYYFSFVSCLESLQSLYPYFYRSNKCHVELQKLASLMKTKRNKVFKSNTIHWISIKSSTKRILEEHKIVDVKMEMDITPSPNDKGKCLVATSDNFNTLIDIELLLSLACF